MIVLNSCTDPVDGFHDRVLSLVLESIHVDLSSANDCLCVDPSARCQSPSNLASSFISTSLNPAANLVHDCDGVCQLCLSLNQVGQVKFILDV